MTRRSAPTKALVGQLVLVFAIVVAPLWSATQWAAAQLGYPPQLGASWFLIFTFPIYYPGRHFE